MDLYFAGSIRAGRALQPVYHTIVTHLQAAGHTVLTEVVASASIEADERMLNDAEIFARDIDWLRACDAVIAEVTVPSLGVGYEIAYALHVAHKPVLGLYQRGIHLSAMLLGDSHPALHLFAYASVDEACAAADRFLAGLQRQAP